MSSFRLAGIMIREVVGECDLPAEMTLAARQFARINPHWYLDGMEPV